MALAAALRQSISNARPDLQVGTIETQTALVRRHIVRERLLATLSVFFAGVAIVLACVGLYGVLHYSVIQQRREIGIRIALGARVIHVVGRVTGRLLAIVCLGSVVGIAAGLACERFVETLLFEVKPTDPRSVAFPISALALAALCAAVPPLLRATRIDPACTLREP
jgi:ABC-type antimicrobial peptide transport system permease subunit